MATDEHASTPADPPDRSQVAAGVVVFAANLARVSAFYAAVLNLRVTESESYHIVLESATYQLAVVEMPPHLSSRNKVTDPPTARSDAAVKPVFVVPSLGAARPVVATHGGLLLPPAREWRFQDWLVCDGHDPEGNVIQLRELA